MGVWSLTLGSDTPALSVQPANILLGAFSVSDNPLSTWERVVSKTQKGPYPTEDYLLLRTHNLDVPIAGDTFGRMPCKSSLLN